MMEDYDAMNRRETLISRQRITRGTKTGRIQLISDNSKQEGETPDYTAKFPHNLTQKRKGAMGNMS